MTTSVRHCISSPQPLHLCLYPLVSFQISLLLTHCCFLLVSYTPWRLIIPTGFLLKRKSSMHTWVDQEQICCFPPRSFILRSPNPPLTPSASLFLFPSLSRPHLSFLLLFLFFVSASRLISFYPGAQQINRYCIMAKTGKAPLCPWHLINGNPLICCL